MHRRSIASYANVSRRVASLGQRLLPIWENVWKTSLLEEMRRVCAVSEWTRPEQAMQKSAYGPLSFDDVLASRVGDALRDCEHQESLARQEGWRARRPTLRQLVLDQLQSAGREGSKAAPIRTHAKRILERDFHVKPVGMTFGKHPTFARDHEYKRHGTVSLLAGIDHAYRPELAECDFNRGHLRADDASRAQ